MSESVSAAIPPSAPRRLTSSLWFLLVIAIILAAAYGWRTWGPHVASGEPVVDLGPEALDARLLQVESAVASLRRSQEALNQKLTDTRARTGLLRDEVLAVTQRSSLLEDSVRELSNTRRDGVAALRLDEVELLLSLAQQRLQLAGDLPGAVRATELAEGVLSSQRDPALLDLRQTLAQELSALRALPKNPAAIAAGELDALEAVLPKLADNGVGRLPAARADAGAESGSGLQRLLDSLVQVRRSGEQDLLAPADRQAGQAALALEIALARTALGRGDEAGFRRSLLRLDGWLQRLYRDSPQLRERRQHLAKLRTLALTYQLPTAGSTLAQLHELQRRRPVQP
jgi:uroporphyrin-3 C-methyltransferase